MTAATTDVRDNLTQADAEARAARDRAMKVMICHGHNSGDPAGLRGTHSCPAWRRPILIDDRRSNS